MNRILRSYDRNIFRISDHFIRVVFPFAKSPNENDPRNQRPETVNETVKTYCAAPLQSRNGKRILRILQKQPEATYEDLAKRTGLGRATVARVLKELAANGAIIRYGSDKKGGWKVM